MNSRMSSQMSSQNILICLFLLLTGCGLQEIKMESGDYSLARVKHSVKKSLPLGVRDISENEREYFSNYFIQRKGKTYDAANMDTRKYAHVWILGDMRPYKISVEVIVELREVSQTKIRSSYRVQDSDKQMAIIIMRKINRILNKRHNNSNIVDDFRVF